MPINVRELITDMRSRRNMKFIELHKKFNEQADRPMVYSAFSKTITNGTLRAKDFQIICDILGYDFYIKKKGVVDSLPIADIVNNVVNHIKDN